MNPDVIKTNNGIADFLIDEGKGTDFIEKSPHEQWAFLRKSDAYRQGMHKHHHSAMKYAQALSAHLGEADAAQEYYYQNQADEQVRKNQESLNLQRQWRERGKA